MELILIAAMAANGIIGKNNSVPWHIPEEVAHFKNSTMGHTLIMGRKTLLSIGRALPGRQNIVLTTNKNFTFPDCTVAHTLHEGIASCHSDKIFIIGGETLYRQTISLADTILLSVLNRDYEGDTSFPKIPLKQFQLTSQSTETKANEFSLLTYQRRKPDSSAI